MSKKAKVTDSAAQQDRFIETARALGCDEDLAAFDEKLKVIARHKPRKNQEESLTKAQSEKPSSGQSRK